MERGIQINDFPADNFRVYPRLGQGAFRVMVTEAYQRRTKDYRMEVSGRIKEDYGNGRSIMSHEMQLPPTRCRW
jgi:hypothetical protein